MIFNYPILLCVFNRRNNACGSGFVKVNCWTIYFIIIIYSDLSFDAYYEDMIYILTIQENRKLDKEVYLITVKIPPFMMPYI